MKTCPKCLTTHTKNGVYCSRSCANSRQWTAADKQKKSIKTGKNPQTTCKRCQKEFRHPVNSVRIYCSLRCREDDNIDIFNAGGHLYRDTQRRFLAKNHGYHCSICDISEWQGQPITLQVDHIDGNATNNDPDNLRLICPNCHSQTETFSGRNKGSGRKARGLPSYY